MNSDSERSFDLTPINEVDDNVSMNGSESSINTVKSKRGRKRIPECWSRVISLRYDDLSNLKTYELGPDITLINALKAT